MTVNKESQSPVLVAIKDAAIRVGRTRVMVIDKFTLRAGQHWCVFGGNGTGKTLLARLISGEMVLGQRHVSYPADFDPKKDIVNVSFEEQQKIWEKDNRHDLSEYMADAIDVGTTVAELILGDSGPDGPTSEEYARVLQTLGIEQLQNSGVRYLSSGQVRKVLIARAVLSSRAGHARLLVIDDPLEAIDRQSQPGATKLLQYWMSENNSTLLLCRRQQDILPGITHMAVMEDLRITRQGPLDEVRQSPEFRKVIEPGRKLQVQIPEQNNPSTRSPNTQPPIRLDNVTARYQDKLILNKVSWLMSVGHNTLIEGPNGCGKSTLLSLIDGENHKAYGQNVFLFGTRRGSGESVWDIKAHFGVISNEIHNKYVKGWKVLDVVVSGFFDSVGLYDDSGAAQIETARQWLSQLGMSEMVNAYYQEISFGQQRLVLLARAMVKQPDVLILDEPCVGLDDNFRRTILGLVDAIADSTATQIIFVSHTQGEEPACINQHIRFVAAADGGYTLQVS